MGLYLHYHPIVILVLALLLSERGDSSLTEEILRKTGFGSSLKSGEAKNEGINWAVLVAGSRGYGNYRHQADVCHAYQILKRGGLKDENIIVFMYDDIAFNVENPRKGVIINNPKGVDVYRGVPKDYTGDSLTTNNLLAVLLGNKSAIHGGSGKVVSSGPSDRIFIYYSDHGSPGVLTMPNDDLYAKDFIDTLKKKYQSRAYKSMVIYVEACEAGSIFEGLLEEEWNIYATTASNPNESSWATYCPGFDPSPPFEYDTCLGDLYSVAWMEDSDMHNTESETLEKQYEVVKIRTAKEGVHGSHVMEYGNRAFSKDHLSLYFGSSSMFDSHHNTLLSSTNIVTVEQHEADILYLKRKVLQATKGSMKRNEAQKALDVALSHRQHIDRTFQNIAKALFGDKKGYDLIKMIRPAGQPIVDDWNCFKMLVGTYQTHCGALSTYGKKHMRVFANLCNVGVHQSQLATVASQICGNMLN